MAYRKDSMTAEDVKKYIGKVQELQTKCIGAYHFSVDIWSTPDYFDPDTKRLNISIYYKKKGGDEMQSYDISQWNTRKEGKAEYIRLKAQLTKDGLL